MGLSPEPSFEYRHRLRTELAGISDLDFLLVRSIRFSCPGHNEFAIRALGEIATSRRPSPDKRGVIGRWPKSHLLQKSTLCDGLLLGRACGPTPASDLSSPAWPQGGNRTGNTGSSHGEDLNRYAFSTSRITVHAHNFAHFFCTHLVIWIEVADHTYCHAQKIM